MKTIFKYSLILLITCSFTTHAQRSKNKALNSKQTKQNILDAQADAYQGFFDFYYESNSGKVFLGLFLIY
jgi:outer membrane biogenesis lipoprotein LolB